MYMSLLRRMPPGVPGPIGTTSAGALLLTSCSRQGDTRDTQRHQTTQDDTWNRISCVARATLGSGGREAVGVRVSPLAPPLTCGSLLPAQPFLSSVPPWPTTAAIIWRR